MEFHSGKAAGTTFEKVFERHCQLAGLWPYQNHITAKRVWKGRLQEQKSNLDFTLMGRGARIGFFDCKTFDEAHFTHSKINSDQLALSRRYNEMGFESGFVIWFRPVNWVSFFPGWLIGDRGPGTRFLPQDGKHLGSWERLEPLRLLQRVPPSCSLA